MAYTQYFIGNKNNGIEWDCQPKNFDGQMQNIDGIGFSKTSQFGRVQDFFTETYKEKNQDAITGEMVFLTEEKYNEFIRFIQSGPLYIKRITSDTKTIYIDVELVSFKRNDKDRFLDCFCLCDIDFMALSPWFKISQTFEYLPEVTGNTKTYSYQYPYQYRQNISSVFDFNIDSPAGAITSIRIFGEVSEPSWILTSPDGLLEGKYNGTVSKADFLLIESKPSDLGVFMHRANGLVLNEWKNIDGKLDTFIYLPQGYSQLEVLSSAGSTDIRVSVEVREVVYIP